MLFFKSTNFKKIEKKSLLYLSLQFHIRHLRSYRDSLDSHIDPIHDEKPFASNS